MKKRIFLFLSTIILTLVACQDEYPNLEDGLYAEFKTNKGDFVAELYHEKTPITVASFVSLAEGTSRMVDSTYEGKKFYDGLTFHRIIDGFVIQGGDPDGTGAGNPGYRFPDEIVEELKHDSKGILSMANAGPGTNGSQFFITLAPTPNLDGRHTVFGKVVEGQEVVDSIGQVETDANDRPSEPVIMNEVKIIRKGKAAKDFDAPDVFEEEMAATKAEEEELAAELEEEKRETTEKFEALKEEAEELEDGLLIYYDEKGDGETPDVGDDVQVHYEGYFADGTLFDTSKEEVAKEKGIYNQARANQGGYGPMVTKYGPDAPLIPGFRAGIQEMSVGDKATLFIPSHLGYGERGAGGVIPPNTDLIFKVELVGIQESETSPNRLDFEDSTSK